MRLGGVTSDTPEPVRSRPASLHVEPVGLSATARHYIRDLVYGANDGTITSFAVVSGAPGGSLPAAATSVSNPALLHLYTPDNAFLDFAELRRWPGQCVTIQVPAVAHSDFLTFARLRPVDPNASGRRDRVIEKFSSILRLTREFLESSDATARRIRLESDDRALGLAAAPCRAV